MARMRKRRRQERNKIHPNKYRVLEQVLSFERESTVVGCTAAQLRQHLEKQFKPGMTWQNRKEKWEIDFIVPYTPQTKRTVYKYTNLRPEWIRPTYTR